MIGEKLIDILNAVKLGAKSYKKLTENILVAVIFNILGMMLAGMGMITPMMAIVFMIVSICAIFLNTLTVRTMKFEKLETHQETDLMEATFKVRDMVCEGCAEKITSILKELPGVKEIKPKVMQKKVQIKYYGKEIGQEELLKTINQSGYHATEA